jgi:hypothetical protein
MVGSARLMPRPRATMTMARPSAAHGPSLKLRGRREDRVDAARVAEGETVGSAGDGELVGWRRRELLDRAGDRRESEEPGPGVKWVGSGRRSQDGRLEEDQGAGLGGAQGEEGRHGDSGGELGGVVLAGGAAKAWGLGRRRKACMRDERSDEGEGLVGEDGEGRLCRGSDPLGAGAAEEVWVVDARVAMGELGRAHEAGDVGGHEEMAGHRRQDAVEGRIVPPGRNLVELSGSRRCGPFVNVFE